jgi:hypothetical protein
MKKLNKPLNSLKLSALSKMSKKLLKTPPLELVKEKPEITDINLEKVL